MNKEGWRALLLEAVHRHNAGDDKLLDLTAFNLEMFDRATQDLKDWGYGCSGVDIVQIVGELGKKCKPKRRKKDA